MDSLEPYRLRGKLLKYVRRTWIPMAKGKNFAPPCPGSKNSLVVYPVSKLKTQASQKKMAQ